MAPFICSSSPGPESAEATLRRASEFLGYWSWRHGSVNALHVLKFYKCPGVEAGIQRKPEPRGAPLFISGFFFFPHWQFDQPWRLLAFNLNLLANSADFCFVRITARNQVRCCGWIWGIGTTACTAIPTTTLRIYWCVWRSVGNTRCCRWICIGGSCVEPNLGLHWHLYSG